MDLPEIKDLKQATLEETWVEVNKLIVKLKNTSKFVYKDLNKYGGDCFDETVRLIIVDALHMSEGVTHALLSQDRALVKRALKCTWYFEDGVTAEEYVKEILPNLSVSTRLKVINKLGRHLKSTEDGDHIMFYVREAFGIQEAEILLPRCSTAAITSHMNEFKPMFNITTSQRALPAIFKRCPDLIEHILTHAMKFTSQAAVKYLARYHPDIWLTYHKKCINCELGPALSRSLAVHNKALLIQHCSKIQAILHIPTVYNEFKETEKANFLVKICGERGNSNTWFELVNTVSMIAKRYRNEPWERLLEAAHQMMFETCLWETKSGLELENLHPLISAERRRQCAITLSDTKDSSVDVKWLHLLPPEEAIPKLKNVIQQEHSDTERFRLLEKIVRSCELAQDLNSLETVVDHIARRHRNENVSLIMALIEHILRYFDYKKLTLATWDKLEHLALRCIPEGVCSVYLFPIIQADISFRLTQNLPVNDLVTTIVAFWLRVGCIENIFSVNNAISREHYKTILRLYNDEIVSLGTKIHDNQNTIVAHMLQAIQSFNIPQTSDNIQIKELTYLCNYFNEGIISKDISAHSKCTMLTVLHSDREARKCYSQLLLDMQCPFPWCHDDTFSLIHIADVATLFNHLLLLKPKLITSFLRSKRVSLFFHGIQFDLHNLAKSKFLYSGNDLVEVRIKSLYVCANLGEIALFKEMVNDFLPKENVLLDNSEIGQIQLAIAKSIKCLKPHADNFSLMFEFFKGDFLKAATTSLYSLSFNFPVVKTLSLLLPNWDGPVSAKIKILYCIVVLMPPHKLLQFLTKVWETESIDSVRFHILKVMGKLFLNLQNDASFEILTKFITSCNSFYDALLSLSFLPDKYLWKYITTVLEALEKLPNKNQKINSFFIQIENLKETAFSGDDSNQLILKYLFAADYGITIAMKYINNATNEQLQQRLDTILSIMVQRKEKDKQILQFIERLRETPANIIEFFLSNWAQVFPIYKYHTDFIVLTWMELYQSVVSVPSQTDQEVFVSVEIGRKIRTFIIENGNKELLIPLYNKALTKFLDCIIRKELSFYIILFLRQFVTPPLDRSIAILTILVLSEYKGKKHLLRPEKKFSLKEHEANESFIREILINMQDETINKYYFSFLQ